MCGALALALAIPLSLIEVTGDEVCPRPADVQRHLRELLPPEGDPGPAGTVAHHARVSRAGEKTRLELVGADGARIAERELDRGGAGIRATRVWGNAVPWIGVERIARLNYGSSSTRWMPRFSIQMCPA